LNLDDPLCDVVGKTAPLIKVEGTVSTTPPRPILPAQQHIFSDVFSDCREIHQASVTVLAATRDRAGVE
jgi:hypothetical protein